MPDTKLYQVWNPQQKMWVKMRDGKILENSSFKFQGLPVFGKNKPSGNDYTAEDTERTNVEDNQQADSEEDGFTFNPFFD